MHLKSGDEVIVIAGSDRGKRGRVRSVDQARGRVIVEGVNIVKRHQKAAGVGRPGGIIEKEASLDASNVMLSTKGEGKPTRIKREMSESGKRVRLSKRSGEVLD